jgi:ribosomal protein S18 acetylase RimI-like enzyme
VGSIPGARSKQVGRATVRDVQIRPGTVEDAALLWKAEVETARTAGRLVSRSHELLLEAFQMKLRELGPGGCYVVALEEGEISGHAFLEPMSLEALRQVYRLTIVVHPGRTGRGVGTALLTHLQGWAASLAGLRKVELLVRDSNPGAIRLYQRLGFVEEGRFRDRIRLPDGTFVDDVAMAWFPPGRSG